MTSVPPEKTVANRRLNFKPHRCSFVKLCFTCVMWTVHVRVEWIRSEFPVGRKDPTIKKRDVHWFIAYSHVINITMKRGWNSAEPLNNKLNSSLGYLLTSEYCFFLLFFIFSWLLLCCEISMSSYKMLSFNRLRMSEYNSSNSSNINFNCLKFQWTTDIAIVMGLTDIQSSIENFPANRVLILRKLIGRVERG